MGSNTNQERLTFTGERLKNKGFQDEARNIDIRPYIPDKGLIEAVNLALLLKRPLLLMGEPGCGKTRLAEAVAFEFYGKNYPDYYQEWRIKSSTKAKEGLYNFDALQKFYDIQMEKKNLKSEKLGAKGGYFQPGELGKVLLNSKEGKPFVLLIDEIDKADIDFPNDLLNELERYDFKVTETGQTIPAPKEKPLVIITSNKEKGLPPAFLRRCLYYYINFPDEATLRQIVEANYTEAKEEQALINKALATFQFVRTQSQGADKNVSTSELLDWVRVLTIYSQNEAYRSKLDAWVQNNAEVNKLEGLPFPQTLLKDEYLWNKLHAMINKPAGI